MNFLVSWYLGPWQDGRGMIVLVLGDAREN